MCYPHGLKRRKVSKRTKPATKPKDSFESVAKRLECDPNKASFEAKLGKLAKATPKPGPKGR